MVHPQYTRFYNGELESDYYPPPSPKKLSTDFELTDLYKDALYRHSQNEKNNIKEKDRI